MQQTNLLVGRIEWAKKLIPHEDQEMSSDITFSDFDRMSIKEVRTLIYEAGMRPSERSYRVFIISCGSILHEAQNALLKLFEEPNAHTVFYFIIPRMNMLLPTLKSRFHVLGIEERGIISEISKDFFSATYAERLALISKKIDAEDSLWIQALIESFAGYAHAVKHPELMRDVLLLETYIHTSGSSKKMLFEHIALSIPEAVQIG